MIFPIHNAVFKMKLLLAKVTQSPDAAPPDFLQSTHTSDARDTGMLAWARQPTLSLIVLP